MVKQLNVLEDKMYLKQSRECDSKTRKKARENVCPANQTVGTLRCHCSHITCLRRLINKQIILLPRDPTFRKQPEMCTEIHIQDIFLVTSVIRNKMEVTQMLSSRGQF